MNKKKTIIYGGAFNPPTIAHEDILKSCIDHAIKIGADVWILPSGHRPDKYIQQDIEVRLLYIDAMIKDVDLRNVAVTVARLELDRSKPVETIDTVHELIRKFPNRDFIWVFGADSIITMPNWRGGKWLTKNLNMLVIKRAGIVIECRNDDSFKVIDCRHKDISSTELRRRLSANLDISNMVGDEVGKLLR